MICHCNDEGGSLAPLLSIVTVTKDNDIQLQRTVSSVTNHWPALDQIEIIVVDGGSGSLADKLKALNNPRIRVIKETDRGIFDAMNKGWNASRGKWVVFLNSGDIFTDKLRGQTLVDSLSTNLSLWCVGKATIDTPRKVLDWKLPKYKSLKFRLGLNSFPHQSTFYNRSRLKYDYQVLFNKDSLVADWSLSYQLLLHETPFLLDYHISHNERAGASNRLAFFNRSLAIINARRAMKEDFLKVFVLEAILQITVDLLSKVKNRLM